MSGFLFKFSKHTNAYCLVSDELYNTIISKADNDLTKLWCEIINSTESVYIDDEQTYQSVSTLVETNQGDLLKELFNTLKESENEGKRSERLREGYTKLDERLLDNL